MTNSPAPSSPSPVRGSARGLMPRSATPDAARLLLTRALRGFADGFVSVLLAGYLAAIGLSPLQIGAIVTGTLLGSAAVTLTVGLAGHRWRRRSVLFGASALMAATGLGFATFTRFWPLLLVAVAGTLNPTSGDVSVFLPTEQALISESVAGQERTAIFARFNLAGTFAGALGALASGGPSLLATRFGWPLLTLQRGGFLLYAAIALVVAALYRGLSAPVTVARGDASTRPLARSRGIVLRLAALFSLDTLGGGFIVQSLLVLWLYRRFGLSAEATAALFFSGGLLSACAQLISGRLANRIGLVNTMVYTHLPSNLLLIAVAFAPNASLAVALLLGRMCLSQMDVPARQSLVMSVVPPEERAAAASVTNVPRSLAAAITPLFAGELLRRSSFGWPLILAGACKAVYDLVLLHQFGAVQPLAEADPSPGPAPFAARTERGDLPE